MVTVAPPLFPEMKRRGNKPKEMIAVLATGSAMADTVPPSIVLGSVAGVSIAGFFTSGFAIAAVLLVQLAVLARFKARHENIDEGQARTLQRGSHDPSADRSGAIPAIHWSAAALRPQQRYRRSRCCTRSSSAPSSTAAFR